MALRDPHRRLLDLIESPVSPQLLSHVSYRASLVIVSPIKQTDPSPIPPMDQFVPLLVKRSSSTSGTLLAALVFLDRLQHRVPASSSCSPCSCQRIFLAALIVTTKMLHDTSPRNKHWARYASAFPIEQVNTMERQFLSLMDFQLSIALEDLYHAAAMLEASHSPPPPPPPPPPPIRLPQVIPPIRTTSRLPQHTHSHHRSSTLTAPPALTSSYLMRQQLYSQASNETCYSFSSSTAVPEAVELSTSSSSSSIDSVSSVDMAVYVPPLYNSLFSGMGTSPHFIKEYRKGKGRLRCSEDPPTYSPSPLVRQKMSSGWIPFAHLPRHKKSIPRWLDPLCTQTSVCLSLDDQETHSRTLYRK